MQENGVYIGINDTKSHLLRHYTRYYAKCFTHISHLIHLTILQGIIIILGVDRILRQIPQESHSLVYLPSLRHSTKY